MVPIVWHFLIGMIVSFIGSIPLGSINVSVLQVTLSRGAKAGMVFAIGATLVELVYSFIAIKFSAFLLSNQDVELYIQLVAIPAFVILSVYSFRKKVDEVEKEDMKVDSSENSTSNKSNFFKGIFIGLVNPLQIPFWVAYGTYMLSNEWIKNDGFLLNFFISGIICGTFLLLTLVVVASNALDKKLNLNRFNMDKIIGYVFLGLAIFQSLKLII